MVEADIDVSKGQARSRPASRLLNHFTHDSLQWSSLVAIEGISPHATTTRFRNDVDLEVIFLISLQITLLKAYIFEHPAQDSH